MSLLLDMKEGRLKGETARVVHALLRPLRAPVAVLNTNGVILDASESWLARSGSWALADDLCGVGSNYLETLAACTGEHAADAARLSDGLRSVLSLEAPSFACEYTSGDESAPAWYEFWAAAFGDSEVLGVLVSHTEISCQKVDAQQLRIHRAMHEAAPCPTVVTNRGGFIEWVNPAFCAHTGYTLEEAVGRTPGSLLRSSHQSADFYESMWNTILSGRVWRGRITNRRKDGRETVEDMRIIPVADETGESTHFVGIKDDLTKYLNARKRVEEKNQQYRGLFENNVATMLLIDPESGAILDANPAAAMYYGWSRNELRSMNIARINTLSPEEIKREMQAAKQEERNHFHFRHRRAGGEVRDVEVFSVPITVSGRRLLYSIVHDVTKVRAAENRLQHLNLVLRSIRDINQLIVRERNPQRIIQRTCQILVQNRGYIAAVVVRTGPDDAPMDWAFAGDAGVYMPIHSILADGKLPTCCQMSLASSIMGPVVCSQDSCLSAPLSGKPDNYQNLCVPLDHEGRRVGMLIVSVGCDMAGDKDEHALLTELAGDIAYALHVHKVELARAKAEQQQEELAEQLLMAQKLESVGQLAGGVAHDFNNMLGVIRGYAEIGLDAIDESHPLYKNLKEIHGAALRSCGITRQLLAFARKQTIEPRPMNLNDTIETMLKFLRRLIGENIELAWRPGPDLWTVKMDPAQVDQILANLCVNARDAIEGVGTILIETRNTHLEPQRFQGDGLEASGNFVRLSVTDTGKGMDAETRKRLFDPFFTTKALGQGTGLGLSTTYGIMKQNQGFVDVKSKPGEGTAMHLYFPRHHGEVKTDEGRRLGDVSQGHGETILLVEDEPAFRVATVLMLERLGYQVVSVTAPLDALEVARQQGEAVDLLLTDVVMPQMDGRALASQLKAVCGGMKVLYMSGYTADIVGERGVIEGGVHFLQKPFSFDALGRKVREVLAG